MAPRALTAAAPVCVVDAAFPGTGGATAAGIASTTALWSVHLTTGPAPSTTVRTTKLNVPRREESPRVAHHSDEDVLRMLDSMFDPEADRWTDRGAGWWDRFYTDRDRGVPFFQPAPDESLVTWHRDRLLEVPVRGRALDLGCGPGRNAVWLARQGYQVDALDLSPAALDWGRERAAESGVEVNFVRTNIFEWDLPDVGYDLVYDSGCFHHLPPHRRISYRSLLERALAHGGGFGLGCFAAGGMGSEAPDASFYRERRLSGGLAYTDHDLRSIFGWLTEVELRRMRQMPEESDLFGESFLWAGLFRRHSTMASNAAS